MSKGDYRNYFEATYGKISTATWYRILAKFKEQNIVLSFDTIDEYCLSKNKRIPKPVAERKKAKQDLDFENKLEILCASCADITGWELFQTSKNFFHLETDRSLYAIFEKCNLEYKRRKLYKSSELVPVFREMYDRKTRLNNKRNTRQTQG